MDKEQTMSVLSCLIDDNLNIQGATTSSLSVSTSTSYPISTKFVARGCWDYWHQNYYPYVIHESYPVYLQERSQDKGKKAFEIIKILKDKRFVQLEKVSDFINLMDELIKII